MNDEALIQELAKMQKDMNEIRRGIGVALTRYNHLNYRINTLKRKISASLRKGKAQAQPKVKQEEENQTSLKFE